MKITNTSSDPSILREIGQRIARYRLNANRTQSALAKESGVSLRTLHRLEHGESVQAASLFRVLRALGLLDNLEALVPPPVPSPLQQWKRRGKLRQRASSGSSGEERGGPWSWGGGG